MGTVLSNPTTFVGRVSDVERLRAAIDGRGRLVTVCGPPGVGKSRLVVQAMASAAGDTWPGGVWWCDTSGATDPATLCTRLAETLRTEEGAGPRGDEVSRLGVVMAQRPRLLIVLDGFEGLVATAAHVVSQWLAAAPDVCVVVTSRERLRLTGEQLVELAPLAVDSAIELFDDRARAANEYWDAAAHRDVVGDIVERLDCLPFAVELAAARMDLVGPADLLLAIDERLDALATAPRDAAGHHATLEAALHASWHGLSEREQLVLAQASVFRGSFDLDAARAVFGVSGSPPLLEVLHGLRLKSLLVPVPASQRHGHMRFRLYETVRRFAAARLVETGDDTATRARHALHFARPEVAWTAADVPDILAVAHAHLDTDPPLGLRAVFAAEPQLWRSGRPLEVITLLERALAAPGASALLLEQRARALELRGRARRVTGDVDGASADIDAALDTWDKLGDHSGVGRALYEKGTLAVFQGRVLDAREWYEQSLAAHETAGDRLGQATALDGIGGTYYQAGDSIPEAREMTLKALRIAHEIDARSKEAIVRGHLGLFALEMGMLDEARSELESALEIHRELGHVRFEAAELNNLALIEQEQGLLDAALAKFERALELQRNAGDARGIGLSLLDAGVCREEAGDLAGAAAAYAESLRTGRLIDEHRMTAMSLAYQGRLAAREGRVDQAHKAFEDAERAMAGHENVEVTRLLAYGRAHLDPEAPYPSYDGLGTSALRAALRILRSTRTVMPPALVLERDKRAFVALAGCEGSLLERPTLWRVLLRLAEHRVSHPGVPLTRAALFEAGWPDENIAEKSAAGRVRTAVYSLRKMGLAYLLNSSHEGYLISPDYDVAIE